MNEYVDHVPDKWVVVKINGSHPHYRVFASWYGGYLGSDSWRLNSGITSLKEEENYYLFSGSSGSVYKCHKNQWGTNGYGGSVLGNLIKNRPELAMEILPEETNLFTLEWT